MPALPTVIKHGTPPYRIALLHGGPGAAGEMRPVAQRLSRHFGILECIQTQNTITALIEELHGQLAASTLLATGGNAARPVTLVGFSWGAWLAFIFASRYPLLVGKLILISAGSFVTQYNCDLMGTRLMRLSPQERAEAERLIVKLDTNAADSGTLFRFGELMTIADAYDYQPVPNKSVTLNAQQYQSIWPEAARMRDTGELLRRARNIHCPVVAIHGTHDPHPLAGVKEPLSIELKDFRMHCLDKCGHTPWTEKHASNEFYKLLENEFME